MANRGARMWPAVAAIACLLHVVWAVAFAYIVWANPYGAICQSVTDLTGASLQDSTACRMFERSVTAIRSAGAIDRLDILGLALSAIAAVLAVAGLGGFFMVRQYAVSAAEDEARQVMDRVTEPFVYAYLNEHGDSLIGYWAERNPWVIRDIIEGIERGEDEISDDAADQIAQEIGQ